MHAQNIVAGEPYAQTNYVYNPDVSLIGPRFFPPVWPAFLAIPYSLHGYDVETLKLYMIVIFGGILVLTFVLAHNRLNAWAAILPVTGIAISPAFWDFKENLGSEFFFTLIVLVTLIVIERVFELERGQRKLLAWGTVSGLLIALSSGTRAIGVILLPALIFHDLVKYRRVQLVTLWIMAIAGLGLGLLLLTGNFFAAYQNLSFATADGSKVSLGIAFNLKNFSDYFRSLTALWYIGPASPIARILSIVVLAAAALGFIRSVLERFSYMDAFILGYSGAIIFLPFDPNPRLLLPIMPLVAIYATCGFTHGLGHMLEPYRHWGLIVVCTCFIVSAADSHRNFSYAGFSEGPLSSNAQLMIKRLRALSSGSSVVTFRKPRLLAAFVERPVVSFAFEHAFNNNDRKFLLPNFERDLKLFAVEFLVLDNESNRGLRAAVRDCPSLFERKARYGPYEIYHIDRGATCAVN